MKRLIILILLLNLINLCYGQNRLALLIGNASYTGNGLRNPLNDAADLSRILQNLGFSVTLKSDANQRQMEEAINGFSSQIQNGDVVLFFYSGHGTQVDGENYLIPVNELIESEADCKYKAVNANWLMEKLEKARINIIILDACRDNPFRGVRSGSKGMASMSAKPGGTYIVFATAAGQTAADGQGRNSPFTESLIKNLTLPDLKLEDVIKQVTRDVMQKTSRRQVPWTSGNLTDDFYFLETNEIKDREPKRKVNIESVVLYGELQISSDTDGSLFMDSEFLCNVKPGERKILRNITAGLHNLKFKTSSTEQQKSVNITADKITETGFSFEPQLKTPLSNITPGSTQNAVTDMDGNVYHTVQIGRQIWMVENLKVTRFRNGEAIPRITENDQWAQATASAYCDYNNDAKNSEIYGRLYNWFAVNDARKLAPAGWHVPSESEWNDLIKHLGGGIAAEQTLKESGFTHWQAKHKIGDNASGFTALPAGSRLYLIGNFDSMGYLAYFWSSDQHNYNGILYSGYCMLNSGSSGAILQATNQKSGYSVRCIKD